jgi:tetratricopeptide (TPR) repeat protein
MRARSISLMFLMSVLCVFACSNRVSAQPGGCYSATWREEYCKEKRETLLKKYAADLADTGAKISRDPKNADLYYQRALIYLTMIFNAQMGSRNVEFDGKVYFSDIDKKAIGDLDRAIELAPKSEYLVNRGNVYLAYWQKESGQFGQSETKENSVDEDVLRAIDKLFITNANFAAAEKDFLRAMELSTDREQTDAARERLLFLRQMRGMLLQLNEHIASLIGNKKPADIALADLEYVIEAYKIPFTYFLPETSKSALLSAWLAKGVAAKKFGRDDVALDAFREAEKLQEKGAHPDCAIYWNRANIFLKQKNFDAAIKDVTFAIENNPNCRNMYEFRGDIYFRTGNKHAAVEDYSVLLNDPSPAGLKSTYWKRGKIYLQSGEAEKAAADFTSAIGISSLCEKDYQLRAQAYRLAGNEQAAKADENKVVEVLKEQKNYQPSDYCYYHSQ